MPVLNLQRQMTQVGRIRLGYSTPGTSRAGNPTKIPHKLLDGFRLTSPHRELIEAAADLYGGTPQAWTPDRGSAQWQVFTTATRIPVEVPPQDPSDTQWLEWWDGAMCERRCNGVQEKLSGKPCLCLAEGADPATYAGRRCKLYTRVRVVPSHLPGAGVFRVDCAGFYGATELPGIAEFLQLAEGTVPADLVLDVRSTVRMVRGKKTTITYAVPVLMLRGITPQELRGGRVQELLAARAREALDAAPARPAIGPAPAPARDFAAEIAAAAGYPELSALARDLATVGRLEEFRDALNLRRAAVHAAKTNPAPTPGPSPADDDVIDAEVVEPGDELNTLWMDILAASPWDDTAELERQFGQVIGRSSDEASADDMRHFLVVLAAMREEESA